MCTAAAATIPPQLWPWSENSRTVGGAPSHSWVRIVADQAPGCPCTTASIEATLPVVTRSRPSRREISARNWAAVGHCASAPARRTHDTSAAPRSHSSARAPAGASATQAPRTDISVRTAGSLTAAPFAPADRARGGGGGDFVGCGASSRREMLAQSPNCRGPVYTRVDHKSHRIYGRRCWFASIACTRGDSDGEGSRAARRRRRGGECPGGSARRCALRAAGGEHDLRSAREAISPPRAFLRWCDVR
ncbi:uncharacterized protein SOCE836_030200 [Sorangium cellulosum]|uniref:Uncharacterized protein n=1 Tax=Sorangium cellulosum TaxID=56 RepID=A0A4P2QM42_SORCE|nr:uncharacterized protein SOCE836_030200 [Sorangium cellulosum]